MLRNKVIISNKIINIQTIDLQHTVCTRSNNTKCSLKGYNVSTWNVFC